MGEISDFLKKSLKKVILDKNDKKSENLSFK